MICVFRIKTIRLQIFNLKTRKSGLQKFWKYSFFSFSKSKNWIFKSSVLKVHHTFIWAPIWGDVEDLLSVMDVYLYVQCTVFTYSLWFLQYTYFGGGACPDTPWWEEKTTKHKHLCFHYRQTVGTAYNANHNLSNYWLGCLLYSG